MNDKEKLDLFFDDSETINGHTIRNLSAGSSAILLKVESPFFKTEKTEYEEYKSSLDFLYVHVAPLKDVIKSSNDGTFSDKVLEFACEFDNNTILKFNEIVSKKIENLAKSNFEVFDDNETDTKKK